MNRHTIFDTPIVAPFCQIFSRLLLWLSGWKVEGERPDIPKYVMIAAPHTSNWDFYYTILMAFHYRLKIYWMGKSSLFDGWRGPIMRWLGGIAVNRNAASNLVNDTVETIKRSEKITVVVPPEGTRGEVTYWKSGFYYIAHGAGVPIVLGYLDFARKRGGLGPVFMPTGDFEADIKEIQKFYEPIQGKHRKNFSGAAVQSRKDSEQRQDKN